MWAPPGAGVGGWGGRPLQEGYAGLWGNVPIPRNVGAHRVRAGATSLPRPAGPMTWHSLLSLPLPPLQLTVPPPTQGLADCGPHSPPEHKGCVLVFLEGGVE